MSQTPKPSAERLVPCPEPSAAIRLFETQEALLPDGVIVERYATSTGKVFEKHKEQTGVVHWFYVMY